MYVFLFFFFNSSVLCYTKPQTVDYTFFFLCHSGQPRYRYCYSKQSAQWVAKPIYVHTQQAFRDDLVERVLKRREDPTVIYTEPLTRRQPRRRRLLQNIAPVPRPPKAFLLSRHSSRFKPYWTWQISYIVFFLKGRLCRILKTKYIDLYKNNSSQLSLMNH